MEPYSCFVINLDSSVQRFERISQDLDRSGIEFTRVSAVDGRGRSAASFPEVDTPASQRNLGRELSGGEVGCYLSHLKVLQEFVDGPTDAALVLEDDASISGPEFADTLRETKHLLDQNAPDWGIVNLCTTYRKRTKHVGWAGGFETRRAFMFPVLTTGLLWSRAGARSALSSLQKVDLPIDLALRKHFTLRGGGYLVAPTLIQRPNVPSDIGQDRKNAGHGKAMRLVGKCQLYLAAWRNGIRETAQRRFVSARPVKKS